MKNLYIFFIKSFYNSYITYFILFIIFHTMMFCDNIVNNINDSGVGSLRAAIVAANSNQEQILIQTNGQINLSSDLPLITESYPIIVSNGFSASLSGSNLYRLFVITSSSNSMSIEGLELKNGKAIGGSGGSSRWGGGGGGGAGVGGAVFCNSGVNIELKKIAFNNNSAQGGSGGSYLVTSTQGGGGGGGIIGNGSEGVVGNGGGAGGGLTSASGLIPGNGGGAGQIFGSDTSGADGSDFGGGGGVAGRNNVAGIKGGNGGFGGGGGGGGDTSVSAPNNPGSGGNGGFGGGGGGSSADDQPPNVAPGGYAGGAGGKSAGNADQGGGGGGAGLGGAIFLKNEANVTLTDCTFSGNSVQGGSAGVAVNPDPAAMNGTGLGVDIFITGRAFLTVNQVSSDQIIPSNIEGVAFGGNGGGLIKTGTAKLTLSGTNTYTGGTTFSAGSLSVAADNNLGASSGALTFNGGTLLSTTGFTSARAATLSGAGRIEVTGTPLTLSGVFSGPGTFIKAGSGTCILSGANTYSAGTNFSGGSLSVAADNNLGNASGALIFTGGTLLSTTGFTSTRAATLSGSGTIDVAGTPLTLSGVFGGTGSLTKSGVGTLVLSGTNTYSGGTIVSAGILQGTTTSLQGAITNNASVIFDQAANGTYSGAISGSGILTKTGLGKVTLSGVNTFAGTTSIQQGTLDVNGSLSSPVMISSSATLQGTGSVGTVQNNGTVVPGASIGTLTITGDYTQAPTASLIIEIDDVPAISDLLLITGTANLDGSIGLNPLPGLYEAGTTYTFLQASAINGTFSQLIETHPLDFVVNYFPNSVDIVVLFSGAIFPTPLEDLEGNAKKIANYLFSCSRISSKELLPILRTLLKVSPSNFSTALLQLGPQQFGSLALSNLQTSTRVGQSMNRTSDVYETYYLTPCYQSFKDPTSGPDQSIWFNPIGYYYKQNEMQEQIPFNSKTYGFTTGFSTRLFNHLVLSAGTGYTHSSLDWYKNNGNAHVQSAYFSPSIGYVGECGYVGLVLLGSRSFYEVNRKIHFSNFKDKAHNHHKSYDLLAGCRGSLRLKFPENFQKNFFLLPTVNLDYLNIFESGYQESGAGALNLSVKNVHSAFLRPEVKLKLLKELNTCSVCSSPSIYVGWLKNIPLTNGNYTSRFYKQETCTKNFTVQSYHSSTAQLILGAEVLVAYKDHCSLKLSYEANIGNHYNVQEGNLNFNWLF